MKRKNTQYFMVALAMIAIGLFFFYSDFFYLILSVLRFITRYLSLDLLRGWG